MIKVLALGLFLVSLTACQGDQITHQKYSDIIELLQNKLGDRITFFEDRYMGGTGGVKYGFKVRPHVGYFLVIEHSSTITYLAVAPTPNGDTVSDLEVKDVIRVAQIFYTDKGTKQ